MNLGQLSDSLMACARIGGFGLACPVNFGKLSCKLMGKRIDYIFDVIYTIGGIDKSIIIRSKLLFLS